MERWIGAEPERGAFAWQKPLSGSAAIRTLIFLALLACSRRFEEDTVCHIPSMVDQYGGDDPPATFGPGVAAPACVRTKHDAIMVLGCPNEDGGAPSACQIARADLAVDAMRAGLGDDFITTGGHVQNAWVEAETLRDLLVMRGVAKERIAVEPQAEHTDENIFWSTRIMQTRGWTTAIVVSEDPRHLVMTAVCDSNCCVRLGRLTIFEFQMTTGATAKLGHYELLPNAPAVTDEECQVIKPKLMCLNLGNRRACAQ